MRLVATPDIEPGMLLASDVAAGRRREIPLIRAGVTLGHRHRQALLDAGIPSVYVDDELSAGIEITPALTAATREAATRALYSAFTSGSLKRAGGRGVGAGAVSEMAAAVRMICRDLEEADHVVLALADLAAADSYTLQHSIDVAALGLLIARRHFREHGRPASRGRRRFDAIDQHLTKLGIGLLLHDIGKTVMPPGVLRKPGRLEGDELAMMREHPTLGVDLMGDTIGPLAKGVIRSHHERWNGSGYPDGRAGQEIPEYARIAAVADVFDAVTSARVYSPAAPAHVGVGVILQGRGVLFDPSVVDTFARVVAPYPPGSEIRLADGRRGLVVSVPRTEVGRPLVRVLWDASGRRVEPEEINLRECPMLAPVLAAA
jgi:HD-GYP domain-containing protein (c-di-GMP phosphodiesterase class II)